VPWFCGTSKLVVVGIGWASAGDLLGSNSLSVKEKESVLSSSMGSPYQGIEGGGNDKSKANSRPGNWRKYGWLHSW
jgi:hypothetical protein